MGIWIISEVVKSLLEAGALSGGTAFFHAGDATLIEDGGLIARLARTQQPEARAARRAHPAWQGFMDGDPNATQEIIEFIGITAANLEHARALGFDVEQGIELLRQAAREEQPLRYEVQPADGEAKLEREGSMLRVTVPITPSDRVRELLGAGHW